MSAASGINAYQEMSRENSDVLIEKNATLVKRIAHHMSGKLPNSVQVEDLIQAGMIGLIEAARNYDATQGAAFETYAGIRIRGAIIDEVRRNGWAPRSVHRKSREAAQAVRTIESQEGREATEKEVATLLGVTLEEYRKIVSEASSHRLLSLDEDDDGVVVQVEARDTEVNNPLLGVEMEKYRDALLAAVEVLPEREQLVMSLYYDEEMNLREIGAVLGVSESRVCQIHGQAIVRLQSKMKTWHQE
ncbi:MAG: RNA polymerase sigma factor FliA [Immundisolibacteraceae bacterium]|jgi:RNA polymerase sigma factor FliA|nr:RNA polymerase sigma factor FliA [Immundisolibacteraceae bacterium]